MAVSESEIFFIKATLSKFNCLVFRRLGFKNFDLLSFSHLSLSGFVVECINIWHSYSCSSFFFFQIKTKQLLLYSLHQEQHTSKYSTDLSQKPLSQSGIKPHQDAVLNYIYNALCSSDLRLECLFIHCMNLHYQVNCQTWSKSHSLFDYEIVCTNFFHILKML